MVAIGFLVYKLYRRRQQGDAVSEKGRTATGASSEAEHVQRAKKKPHGRGDELQVTEQVKFRGSMSSVENRHERVPSKPMVMTITTPKGTRHVADAFGEYDGKEDDLQSIDEEEEATEQQTSAQTQNNDSDNTQPQPQQPQTNTDAPPENGTSVEVNVHSESGDDGGSDAL